MRSASDFEPFEEKFCDCFAIGTGGSSKSRPSFLQEISSPTDFKPKMNIGTQTGALNRDYRSSNLGANAVEALGQLAKEHGYGATGPNRTLGYEDSSGGKDNITRWSYIFNEIVPKIKRGK